MQKTGEISMNRDVLKIILFIISYLSNFTKVISNIIFAHCLHKYDKTVFLNVTFVMLHLYYA